MPAGIYALCNACTLEISNIWSLSNIKSKIQTLPITTYIFWPHFAAMHREKILKGWRGQAPFKTSWQSHLFSLCETPSQPFFKLSPQLLVKILCIGGVSYMHFTYRCWFLNCSVQRAVQRWTGGWAVRNKYISGELPFLGQKKSLFSGITPSNGTLQMKGQWESNINVWFPFMYS